MTDDYAEALARYGVTADELPALLHTFQSKRHERFGDVPLIAMISAVIEHLATDLEAGGYTTPHGIVDRTALAQRLRHLLILTDMAEAEEGSSVTASPSRTCEVCGRAFPGRADARFCSNAHRQAAYRLHKQQAPAYRLPTPQATGSCVEPCGSSGA